ncbi:transcription initiation factor TFIID subunit 7 [Podospora conica]|nr:transcription initiation factor TFIID subunit 7 [Schizothecium conicum]
MEQQQRKPLPSLPPQKRLTLKITGLGSPSCSASLPSASAQTPGGSFSSAMSPPPATPSGGGTKIKIVRKSLPPTPADGVPPYQRPLGPPTYIPNLATPGLKDGPAKIRIKKPLPADSDDDEPLANGTGEPRHKKPKLHNIPINKIKVKTPSLTITGRTPTLKVKTTGRIPHRPSADGWDSEAEDREVDPVTEEQLLFRMMPGEHCEYLRTMIAEKKIGIPKAQGGADISFKFLDNEGRRVVFIIQGQPYAGIVLDLPTITEGMKSWDKKALVKSADICQMVLIFAKVKDEEEAKAVPLPKAVEHGHRWPHGITPPMHDARNRRFRKRLSKLEIQNKDAEVERLLAADKEATSTKFEFVDDRQTAAPEQGSEDEYDEEDAEGEAEDYFGESAMAGAGAEDLDFDEALLEAEFMNTAETPADGMDLATPAVANDAITPATANTTTPAGQTEESDGDGEDESGDEDDDEDGDEEGEDGSDGGDEERHDEVAGVRAEIATLKKKLAEYEAGLEGAKSFIIKKRIEGSIKNIKAEILLKQSAIGEVQDDE